MSRDRVDLIELEEYVPKRHARDAISEPIGKVLYDRYSAQIDVEFPTHKTANQWEFTSLGWVGYIPLTQDFGVRLCPRVALGNLFRMLEYAYRLKSFRFLEGLIDCHSLEEFYERLANVLARRVLDRGRKGYYRTYFGQSDRLPYVRGRMDIAQAIRSPWDIAVYCHYEDHTADIADNQILAWTLWQIARSGMCTEHSLPAVRQAFRSVGGVASPQPIEPQHCTDRIYNRLNDNYQPLHALFRFFLEHRGPSHETGDRQVLPFLVDMPRLFELFVAEWLGQHLGGDWMVRKQERIRIDKHGDVHFVADLVLYEPQTQGAWCVLDTKYKTHENPSNQDIEEVVTYAVAKGCREALLVYPKPVSRPLDEYIGKIRVRSLPFVLDGDLEAAGHEFLSRLFG